MANKGYSMPNWSGGYNHYDENGKKIGESIPNWSGGFDEYDEKGAKVGTSMPNWSGGYNHYDNNWKKTGSDNPNWSGGFDHFDEKGKKTGGSEPSFFGGYNNAGGNNRCIGTSDPVTFPYQAQAGQHPQHGTIEPDGASEGCYIATCVYGSYDCPQVWTLRRFRDNTLKRTAPGRAFVRCYYALSPTVVRKVGETTVFRSFWRKVLDRIVGRLNENGVADTRYEDRLPVAESNIHF